MNKTKICSYTDINGIYTKTYKYANDKLSKSRTIALISDLHYIDCSINETLKNITRNISLYRPDIICFTGDLVHDAKRMVDEDYLVAWIEILSKLAPIYIVKGNHDLLTKKESGIGWQYANSDKLFDQISDIKNVYILTNEHTLEYFEDMVITGFDVGDKTEIYYEDNKESVASFYQYVYPTIRDIKENLDPKQFNILLFHSPENLYTMDYGIYSLLLSGHMHNGLIPNAVDHYLPTNYGIIDPSGRTLPKYTRGYVDLYRETKAIIASPITTLANNENKLVRKLYKPTTQFIRVYGRNDIWNR